MGSIVVAAGLLVGPVSTVFAAAAGGVVRVNQLGYGAFDGKAAYVMTRRAATGAKFQLVDRHGRGRADDFAAIAVYALTR